MASLYQRFSGKINTNNSFPYPPPEASRLLGGHQQQVIGDEENGGKHREPPLLVAAVRAHVPFRSATKNEDEDVRLLSIVFIARLMMIMPYWVMLSNSLVPKNEYTRLQTSAYRLYFSLK